MVQNTSELLSFLVVFLAVFALTEFVYPLGKSVGYLFFTQTFLDPERPYPFNVSWSLAVEEWFYLLFPLVPLALHRVDQPKRTLLLWTVSVSVFLLVPLLLRFYFAAEHDFPWGPAIRNSTILRLDAIAYGALAALWSFRHSDSWGKWRVPSFVIGSTLLVANAVQLHLVGDHRDVSLYCRTLQFSVVSLSVLLMLPLFSSLKTPSSQTLTRWVTNISKWSYSMYLCHMLVIDGLHNLAAAGRSSSVGVISALSGHRLAGIALWIAFVGLTVWISKIVYERFELPMTNLREKVSSKEHKPC